MGGKDSHAACAPSNFAVEMLNGIGRPQATVMLLGKGKETQRVIDAGGKDLHGFAADLAVPLDDHTNLCFGCVGIRLLEASANGSDDLALACLGHMRQNVTHEGLSRS